MKVEENELAKHLLNEKVLNYPVYIVNEEDGDLKYSGENKKGILVLFRNSTGELLNEKDEIFLKKIMEALKLKWEDAALLNHHLFPFTLTNISRHLSFGKAVVFGITPQQIGLQIEAVKYKQAVLNDVKMIFADSLATVAENKKKEKNMLWDSLQKMFGLK